MPTPAETTMIISPVATMAGFPTIAVGPSEPVAPRWAQANRRLQFPAPEVADPDGRERHLTAEMVIGGEGRDSRVARQGGITERPSFLRQTSGPGVGAGRRRWPP
jgi:hypothetical protein